MNMVQQFDPAQIDLSGDLGTPGAASDVMVTVQIDGMPVSVPEGTSVMRAAAMVGANIPKLCATDSLNAFGSCRLCLVEIEGRPGTPASCTTPCQDGIAILTAVRTSPTRISPLIPASALSAAAACVPVPKCRAPLR